MVKTYSFTAGAEYGPYAATMTGFHGGSTDMWGDVFARDGNTVLRTEEGRGAAAESVSNFAGTPLPATASFYVRVHQFDSASLPGAIRPYDFYVRVLSGSPTPEMEPEEGTPQALRSNGWRGRVIGPATAKSGSFAITVNGWDTIGVIVAVDLERGVPVWDVTAGTGVFTGSFIIKL